MNMNPNLLKLRTRVIEAEASCVEAHTQLSVAKEDLRDWCLAELGTSLGGTIKAKKDGEEYQITKAEIWTFDEFETFVLSVHGVPKLKNGTFGNRARYIGTEWTVP